MPVKPGTWLLLVFPVLLQAGCSGSQNEAVSQPGQRKAKTAELPTNLDPQVVDLLENADTLELLSIGPTGKTEKDSRKVQPWPSLGKAVPTGASRRKILNGVYQSLKEGGSMAWCFDPHHVLRAVRGDSTVELVICFKCSNMKTWRDGKELSDFYPFSNAAEAVLNGVLSEAGVPLDPEAK
jgi:hypothetical protein